MRLTPDEMVDLAAPLSAPLGQQPCKWHPSKFQRAVDQYMKQPPSLGASAGGLGFTVEFPYGEESSLFWAMGDEPHPR
jgi:hypothetical protein